MARDWSSNRSAGKEGASRRLPGSKGAIRQIFGKIGRKLAGNEDGWGEEGGVDTGSRTDRGGKGQNN